ncbi:hypothetical protein AXG93_3911s1040 [Marchantia polymorpha subsp. ruderalis]|uniref:ABC transporter domain-containing protein n=1 Tax=Marchantia polymorpha subsp. ruderalis TaxID=1480154 RepID=A0A176W4G4_MARPO|nr:hypothetical protein AXG93_3911s1040 [Marchantia polymorpha subsp. ruderalis]
MATGTPSSDSRGVGLGAGAGHGRDGSDGEDEEAVWEEVVVNGSRNGSVEEMAQDVLRTIFKVKSPEEDNALFLSRLRSRLDKAGVRLPTVEVRYENYSVKGYTHMGKRALPTLRNAAVNAMESCLACLRIPGTRRTKFHILSEVSGIIKPGRMTLVLGPPGSGKTTFLLSLSGQLDPTLKASGKITYNGHELHEFEPRKTAAYISQEDLHVGELTVRETLLYSAKCQGVGPFSEMLAELLQKEQQMNIRPDPEVDMYMKARATPGLASHVLTEYALKILGLDSCADTLVGDYMRRGISGGQKKRVTTGEMMVGPAKTFFMDEISTGLDSSTTRQIVACLRNICHSLESTIVMSLLQPSPETFALFDDVILLSEGQVLFHGDRADVLEFFEDCGFKCPERKATADFLQEVTSPKDQEQYWSNKQQPYQYVTVSQFREAFRTKFHEGIRLMKELETPMDKTASHKSALSTNSHPLSRSDIWRINFAKEWLLMRRNAKVYVARFVKVSIIATLASTLYFHSEMARNDMEDAHLYASAIFYGIFTMLINGYSESVLTIFRLPVFFKHRDLLFLPAWAYTVPKAILNTSVSMVEATLWTVITYHISGFASGEERFFQQLFLYFWIHMMASALFPLVAGVCRTMVLSATAGTCTLLVFFVCGGFLIPRTSLKPWCIWAYWLSPMSFAQNGVSAIEFLAPEWNKTTANSLDNLGVQHMKASGLYPETYWYWIAVGMMIGYTFLFQFLFTMALSYLKPFSNPQAMLSEDDFNGSDIARGGKLKGGRSGPGSSLKKLSLSRSFSSNSRYGEEAANSALEMYKRTLARVCSEASMHKQVSVRAKQGMILPFRPLSISFKNISYFVDTPPEMKRQGATKARLQLLDNVSGSFRPGVLTALVGVSGAGKTTLMDVLAGRKTGGYIEGDIYIAGFPKVQSTFARISGYCEQNDIHSPQVTIYESLTYSAWLRLPRHVKRKVKKQFVQEIMDLVELSNLSNALVGLPGISGLSYEQRKRLTIAVELMANPSIIFMDEPTSGLDSRAAAIVMRTVRNTVDTGRTVVCTIHQPSVDVFESFDELLFLKTGGQVIYAGSLGKRSENLVRYFESIDGVPMIREDYNPASWMLDVTSTSSEIRLGVDFADLYKKSALFQRNLETVNEARKLSPNATDLRFPTRYSRSYLSQTCSILWKFNLTYWRMPAYNNSRFVFTAASALIFGIAFWGLGRESESEKSVYSVIGAMYGSTFFLGIINASTVQSIVSTERTVYYRERAAGMYSSIPYGLSQILIEIPYCFLQSVIYCSITYSMIGLEWTISKFFSYLFFYFSAYLNFTLYGMLAVGITPNEQLAFIVSTFLYGFFNLFAGFLIPKPRIPWWWAWAYWTCPIAYTIYGLVVSQFGDDHQIMTMSDGTEIEVFNYIHSIWGFDRNFFPIAVGAVAAFGTAFAFLFIVSIKVLNFQSSLLLEDLFENQ